MIYIPAIKLHRLLRAAFRKKLVIAELPIADVKTD